jgi:hypothetical protein
MVKPVPRHLVKVAMRFLVFMLTMVLAQVPLANQTSTSTGTAVNGNAAVFSPCSADGWCRASPYLPELVAMESRGATWALVDHGALLQRKHGDERWSTVRIPERNVEAMAAVPGTDDIWLLSPVCTSPYLNYPYDVCDETHVSRWSGESWSTTSLPGHLHSVWAYSKELAWAVGHERLNEEVFHYPVIYRWQDMRWQREAVVVDTKWTNGPLVKVWGQNSKDVWAVGGPAVFHWNGNSWEHIHYDRPDVLHEGKEGFRLRGNYDAIFAVNGEIWIASLTNIITQAIHWDPLKKKWAETPDEDTPPIPKPAWPVDKPQVVAKGEWAHQFGRKEEGIKAIYAGDDGSVWARTYSQALRREDNGWRELSLDKHSTCLCTSYFYQYDSFVEHRSLLWTLGHGHCLSSWENREAEFQPTGCNDFCSLWTSQGLPLFVADCTGVLLQWSNPPKGKPVKLGKPAAPFNPWAMWASAADDIWILSRTCNKSWPRPAHQPRNCYQRLYHWDGKALRGVDDQLPTGEKLRGIHGTAKDDVWIVGDKGIILHYDGSRWTMVPSGVRENLDAVWTGDRAKAWAAGHFGTIVAWDGKRWLRQESGTAKHLRTISGSKAAGLWIGGDEATILTHPLSQQP